MKRLAQYDTFELPVDDIYYDNAFNCRGTFTPQSVSDLADSIREIGLQFPIVVQPFKKPGYKYRLLAGHRRFRAVTIFLKWERVPAVIRADLDEHQAALLNLTENLERKNLNMLEEARALRNLYPDGISLRKAAKEIKRPTRWVHTRIRLLELPEEVQQWAAVGLISAVNIEILYSMESDVERIRATKEIVRSKKQNKTQTLRVSSKFRRKFGYRKTKAQMAKMIAHLYAVQCEGLATRLLAWTAGSVEDIAIEKDIQNAPGYEPPEGYVSPIASTRNL